MNDAADDEIGIRGTAGGGNLAYTNGQETLWYGSGILNKPIGDFFLSNGINERTVFSSTVAPYFVINENNTIGLRFHRHIIPEPAEYALVFGIFALVFVIFHRHFQRKIKKGGGDYGTRL